MKTFVMRTFLRVILCLGLLSGTLSAAGQEPANPNADPSTKAVLRYWASLSSRSENRVISGQFIGHAEREGHPGDMVSLYNRYVTELFGRTGRWVALVGVDYAILADLDEPVDLSATNGPLVAHWRKGGLVTVSWHARNPWTGGSARDERIEGSLSDLITPGTPIHEVWMAELDRIAEALLQLRREGVTVIWRPFHEGNGRSFWWTRSRNPEEQRELWRHMFRTFTERKGLNNLLWAYSALPQRSGRLRPEDYGYPGGGYVDLVGLDVYGTDLEVIATGYQRLQQAAPDKPLWLSEFGPFKGSEAKKNPSLKGPRYDYTRLIRRIREEYPKIVGFQSWNGAWSMAGQAKAKELLEDPWVVTLEDFESS
jgi:mannan endo-1,4-beta-mannosidase